MVREAILWPSNRETDKTGRDIEEVNGERNREQKLSLTAMNTCNSYTALYQRSLPDKVNENRKGVRNLDSLRRSRERQLSTGDAEHAYQDKKTRLDSSKLTGNGTSQT